MADSALETVSPPFMTFRFEVVLEVCCHGVCEI